MTELDEFIASRRSEATKRTYSALLKRLVDDPQDFISLARANRKGSESARLALGMLELRAEMTELSKGIERLTNAIQTKFKTDYY